MTTTLRIGQRARRSVSAVAGVALVAGLGLALAAPVAASGGQVCKGLDSGKVDTTGDPLSVTVQAPAGSLIAGYCVKAGSAAQDLGPEYVVLPEPLSSVDVVSSSGKAVSHYSLSFVPVPGAVSPSPSPSATPTQSSSASPTPTATATASQTPSESSTPTESAEPSLAPSETGTPSGSPTPSETATATQTPTGPAALCPGIDDDTDYRTLFGYEYFAGSASGGWVSLGSTPDWSRPLNVQYLNGFATDPIENMMVRAVVTLKDDVDIAAGDCEYEFSLASYEAEGPTFSTSGQQVFIDHDTDTVTADDTSITLEVDPAECFGQSDLYKGDDVYDGDRAPHGPGYAPITLDGNMIANWGGGYGCDEPTEPSESPSPGTTEPSTEPSTEPTEPSTEPTEPSTEPTEPSTEPTEPSESPSPGTTEPSETPSTEPSVSPSPGTTEPTETPTETPSTEPSESPSPGTTAPSESPSPSTTASASAAPATSGTTTPAVRGAVQRPASALARTGVETWTVALVAGVLLIAGGAMTVLAQASSRGRRH